MLKKLILTSLLLPLISFAGNNYFKPDQERIKLKGSAEVIEKEYRFIVEPKQYYYTKIAYPQITTTKGQPSQEEFNQAVLKIVKTYQENFTKNLQATEQMIKEKGTKGMPVLTEDSNNLIIQYDIANPQNNIISVRFKIEMMNYGMAHPFNFTNVVNYNVSSQKVLELKDLFKPNSDYLQKIASYSQEVLTKRLAKQNVDKEFITKGTAAEAKNYSNWNIVSKGLLITFDPAQVAASYMGRQEVLIPNKVLQQDLVLKTKS